MINDMTINILILMNAIDILKDANRGFCILDIVMIVLCLVLLFIHIAKWIKFYINKKKGIVEYVKDDGIQYVFLFVTPILLGIQLAMLLY